MSELPIQVNALAVEKSDDAIIVRVGSANGKIDQWVLRGDMILLLESELIRVKPKEVPVE